MLLVIETVSHGMNAEPTETYVCEVCDETFESREALERHVHDVGIVD